MNIFWLSTDVEEGARFHCDKHVVKMILEYAQLMSTAHVELDGSQVAYKPTHKNHPCAVWVRQSKDNYRLLYRLFFWLCREYKYRYGKEHKTWRDHSLTLRDHPQSIPDIGLTDLPQCMPEEYYHDDTVQAYRNYYLGDKGHMLKYTNRSVPSWVHLVPKATNSCG